MGIQIGKYQNMADFIIKMAIVPAKVRANLSTQELVDYYQTNVQEKMNASIG
jgi:hypothetical protein